MVRWERVVPPSSTDRFDQLRLPKTVSFAALLYILLLTSIARLLHSQCVKVLH